MLPDLVVIVVDWIMSGATATGGLVKLHTSGIACLVASLLLWQGWLQHLALSLKRRAQTRQARPAGLSLEVHLSLLVLSCGRLCTNRKIRSLHEDSRIRGWELFQRKVRSVGFIACAILCDSRKVHMFLRVQC